MTTGLTISDFRSGLTEGFVQVSACRSCGRQQAIPASRCFQCGSTDLEARTHSGAGTIFSWVVCSYPFSEEMRAEVPYTVLLVDLDGGGRVYGRLAPAAEATPLAAGMRVHLDAATRARGYPVFGLAASPGPGDSAGDLTRG